LLAKVDLLVPLLSAVSAAVGLIQGLHVAAVGVR
jgi:hypothetical protein